MYAITREDGLFFCDGILYQRKYGPHSMWQSFDGVRSPYCEKDRLAATLYAMRLEQISLRQLTIVKLSREDIEYLTFRKLQSA